MIISKETIQSIYDAVNIINNSKYIIALTGAGVSVESNIRPFRGPGGLWTERGEPPMDGYQKFLQDPYTYWEKRLSPKSSVFRESLHDAKPNDGHLAVAELEKMGVLKTLITQNIDNLHLEAGNMNVLEIHGNSHYLRCVNCGLKWHRDYYEVFEIPPRCSECNGIIKSDTVMFGEPIPKVILEKCFEEARTSDCMLILGTSATVHPAATLPILTRRNGGKLIEVNIRPSELSYLCDVNIFAPFGVVMPKIVKRLKS